MNYLLRVCVCALAIGVVFAGLSNFIASWFGCETSVFHLGRKMVAESRRSEALRYRAEMIERCETIKKEIVAELFAKRLTLCEAAEQFRAANEMVENSAPPLVASYRRPGTHEGVCRQVIMWTSSEESILPTEEKARIVVALEKEFEQRFGHPCPDSAMLEEDERGETDAPLTGTPASAIAE